MVISNDFQITIQAAIHGLKSKFRLFITGLLPVVSSGSYPFVVYPLFCPLRYVSLTSSLAEEKNAFRRGIRRFQ